MDGLTQMTAAVSNAAYLWVSFCSVIPYETVLWKSRPHSDNHTSTHTHALTHIEMYPGACVSCRAETAFSSGQELIFRSPPLVSVFLDWIESVKRERMRGEGVWGVRWTLKHYTQADRLNWSAWLPVSTGNARIPTDLSFIWNQLWPSLEGRVRQMISQIRANPINL